MMRRPPKDESGSELVPPPVIPQLDRRMTRKEVVALVTQTRSYELITPLFGGGVEPGVADSVTVIRGSEVRGHLRFWWRACRGGAFDSNLRAMKEREDGLWGAASTKNRPRPSAVDIVVSTDHSGKDVYPFEVVPGSDWRTGRPKPKVRASESVAPSYAAFPLQPSEEDVRAGGMETKTKAVREGVRFTLRITYTRGEQEEVEAALWAWETFGGLGARTRRGFGALKLISIDGKPVGLPAAHEVEAVIREGLQKHVVDGTWPPGVPHLSPNLGKKVTGAHSDPRSAWTYLVQCLKSFRQSRRRGTSWQPGRSLWPEPDEIRRLTNRRCPGYSQPLSTIHKLPRAAFGLPIVFHFKDQDAGDPYDTILRGRDYERMASPLILRPLACANGQAVGLAAILEGTGVAVLPGGLILQGAPDDPAVEAALTPDEARGIPTLRSNPDVLQAFLDTL